MAAAVPSAIPAPPQAEVVRSLDSREIAALIKRGQDLLAGGDVQSARLLLMRGAEARDARAALLVGTTYDPALLRQIGADGRGGHRAGPHVVSAGQGMGRTRRAAKAGGAGALALEDKRQPIRSN